MDYQASRFWLIYSASRGGHLSFYSDYDTHKNYVGDVEHEQAGFDIFKRQSVMTV